MKCPTMLLRTATGIGLAISAALIAQQPLHLVATGPLASIDSSVTSPASVVSVPASAPAQPAKNSSPLTARWLDLKTLSESQRFRSAYDLQDYHDFEDGQQRSLAEGRVKLDPQGQYAIGFRASSGRYFNWAYADYAGQGFVSRIANPAFFSNWTPAQLQALGMAVQADPAGLLYLQSLKSNGWQFYLRELYFSATPVKAVTVEFGSFGFERGVATEITTFDDDGYLSGERIRINDPKHLFFDQVGYTNAFFGNVGQPNFLERGSDLKTTNYREVFAKKQLNERIGISGEYNWLNRTDTLREAVSVGTKELKVANKIRFEAYERLNTVNILGLNINGGSGFAVVAEEKAGTRMTGDFGYASIDKNYSVYYGTRIFQAVGFSLNGDSYGQGNRVFMHATYKINPVVSAFGFYTHAVGPSVMNFDEQNLNAGLTFDVKALVNTGKKVF